MDQPLVAEQSSSKLDGLSSETVFHDINLKLDDDDEFDGDTVLPDPEWETEGDNLKPRVNSDEEWDTDLEDEGTSDFKRQTNFNITLYLAYHYDFELAHNKS